MRHKQQKLLKQNAQNLEAYIKEHNLNKNQSNSCLITPESMILAITEADPDQNSFKNSKWLIKNLLAKNFLWEDIESGKSSKAYDTLSRFLNIRKQWKSLGPNFLDINQYTGLSGIAEKIRPFEITKGMNELKREEKARIYSETIVLYDKNDYLVVIPKTKEASCFWGRGTEWCTASTKSENYFDHYNKSGPLIIAITPDNKKYQFHKNSSPMDENDKEIKDITDPVLVELALLTKKTSNLKYKYWDNPRYCKIAVQNDGVAIKHISSDIADYFEICKLAVQQNGYAIQLISPDIADYFEICKLAVQENGYVLQLISPDIADYLEICKLGVQQNGLAIKHISYDIADYSEICKLAVQQNGVAIKYISPNTKDYLEICKLAVQEDGLVLQYISPNTKDYLEICELAVQNNGLVLYYISLNIENYSELCKLAVQEDGKAFQYILPNTKDYLEICKLTVQQNGYAIQLISPDIADYFEICKLAVQQNGLAIRDIDKDIPEYLELARLAVEQNKLAIQYINKEIPEYSELCNLINDNPKPESETIQTNNISIIPEWLTNKDYEEIIANLEILESSKLEKILTNDLF